GRLDVNLFLLIPPMALAGAAAIGWMRARDQRDRLRALAARLERDARLGELLAHTSDGIFVVAPSGEILTWNPGMERITGFPAAEAVGRTLEERLGAQLRGDLLWPAVVTSEL